MSLSAVGQRFGPKVQLLRRFAALADGRQKVPSLPLTAPPVVLANVVRMEHPAGEALVQERGPSLRGPQDEQRGKGEVFGVCAGIPVG